MSIIHAEISYLKTIMLKNAYPEQIFDKIVYNIDIIPSIKTKSAHGPQENNPNYSTQPRHLVEQDREKFEEIHW